MVVTVASWSSSVTAWRACAMHSHPTRVDNAHWYGAVAAFTVGPNCCGMVLAVTLRTTSPATMPQLDPFHCFSGDLTLWQEITILGRFQQRAEGHVSFQMDLPQLPCELFFVEVECNEVGPSEALECHLALLQGGYGEPSMSLQFLGPPSAPSQAYRPADKTTQLHKLQCPGRPLFLYNMVPPSLPPGQFACIFRALCTCPQQLLPLSGCKLVKTSNQFVLADLSRGVGATASLGATTRASKL